MQISTTHWMPYSNHSAQLNNTLWAIATNAKITAAQLSVEKEINGTLYNGSGVNERQYTFSVIY